MCEDQSMSEFLLEFVKSHATVLVKVPRSAFPGKPCKGNDNVGVSKNKMMVKIAEAEE